jgi:type II secretory pathway pseudopilin PulG
MRSKRRLDNRGSMLLEALVAIALLGIGMSTLSLLMVQHLRAAGTNNLLTTAIALGEQELEDLRSQDYNTGLVSRTSTSTLGTTTFRITTTVTADNPIPNAKSISTIVSWTGLNGSQTYALNTIYTQLQN